MPAFSVTRESDFLQSLVPGYEGEGFSVFLHPGREMLPSFLRGYQPDAIAIKNDKKIAIEIKRDATHYATRMEQIQKDFEANPEWELRVYYIPRVSEDADIEAPDVSEIEAALAEVDELRDAGHFRAALIMAWAALEAAGRVLLPQNLARPQPASKLIEALASEGIVTPTEADTLRKAINLRNAVTHGHFGLAISEQQVDEVVAAARIVARLAKEPNSP